MLSAYSSRFFRQSQNPKSLLWIFLSPNGRQCLYWRSHPHQTWDKILQNIWLQGSFSLSDDSSMTFNGTRVICINGVYSMTQPSHQSTISIIQTFKVNSTLFIAGRVRGAYIVAMSRPIFTFEFFVCSQYPSLDEPGAKMFNRTITQAQKDTKITLLFVPLKADTL